MEQNNVLSVQEIFQQMPTDQLRQLLDKELHSETVNDDAIRLILHTLRQRREEKPVEMTRELEEAWEKYQRDSRKIWQASRRTRAVRGWLIRTAAAAAVLALLLAPIIPQEAGAESLWDTLTRLTAGIVEFFGPRDNEGRIEEYEFVTDNPGLQQVYDNAVELGVTVPVVPMWLPEECELIECKVEKYPSKTRIYSVFSCKDNEIVYYIDINNLNVSHKYQKGENRISEYERGDVSHQIFRNNNKLVAVWVNDNIECSISVDCQEAVFYKILDSIYGMVGEK